MQLFRVSMSNAHVITWAHDSQDAKRKAASWLGNDMERFLVTPLTNQGDRIHLSINLAL